MKTKSSANWKLYPCKTCYTIGLKSVLCISNFTSIFKLCSQECLKNILWKQISIQPVVLCWMGTSMYYVITTGGRWVRKWQFLITFSTERNQKRGVGSESPKTWLRNTWMIPKHIGKCTQSWFNFTRGHKARLLLSKGADGCLDRRTVCLIEFYMDISRGKIKGRPKVWSYLYQILVISTDPSQGGLD